MKNEIEIIKAKIDHSKTYMITTISAIIASLLGFWSVSDIRAKLPLVFLSVLFFLGFLFLSLMYEKRYYTLIKLLRGLKSKIITQ